MTTTVAAITWEPCEARTLPRAAPRAAAAAPIVAAHGERLLRWQRDGEAVIAKRMASAHAARTLAAHMQALARHCRHVPAGAQALEGADGSTWWVAIEYLEGRRYIDEGGDPAVAAAALAQLHAALRALPADDITRAAAVRARRTLGWLGHHAADAEVAALARCAGLDAAGLARALEHYLAQPAQPVHHDLHEGNTWWSRGQLWFLDFEEVASSCLPVAADLARYAERQILLPRGAAAGAPALAAFCSSYHDEAHTAPATSSTLFAAIAWNWLDSWAALHTLAPAPANFASERRKFLAILGFHAESWAAVATALPS